MHRASQSLAVEAFVPRIVGELASSTEDGWLLREGAVLFIDIAGFTPLTERLAERGGSEGAEQLSRLLSTFFAPLIDAVVEFGGDVWGMAGDALIAVWHDAPADAPLSVWRATACALEAIERVPSQVDGEEIVIRASIADGPLQMGVIGGHEGRWVPALQGEPMRLLALLDDAALPNQLTMLARTARLLPDAEVSSVQESGTVQVNGVRSLSAPAVPAALPSGGETTSFAPPAVLRRIASGHDAWLPEFRDLTVCFVNIPAFETVSHAHQSAVLRAVQQQVSDFGGDLARYLVDDKGATGVVVFGGYGCSHEDDAARSLAVANALASLLKDAGFEPAIGLASGTAFVGPVGSVQRSQYSIHGRLMNRAARLMQRAQHEDSPTVLADRRTSELAGIEYRSDHFESATLKGISAPVQVHQPVGYSSAPRRSTSRPLVGRIEERQSLRELYDRVVDGGTAIAVVEGTAGVGKSSLVELVLADLPAPVTLLRARASSIETATPLRAWRPVLLDVLQLGEADVTASQIAAALKRCLPHRSVDAAVVSLLASALGQPAADDDAVAELSPEGRALAIQDIIIDAIRAVVGGNGCVIVLDDGHWMDSASWSLYRRAAREFERTLFIVTTRPSADGYALPGEHPDVRRIANLVLEPFAEHELKTFAEQVIGADVIPAPLLTFIRKRSGGHPLYAEELLRTLLDRSLIDVVERRCHLLVGLHELNVADVPFTIEGAISSRLDALPPGDDTILRIASAIGSSFSHQILRALNASESPQSQQERLRRLVDAGVIVPADPIGNSENASFAFRHAMIRESAYRGMSFARRRALNRTLAEHYEENPATGTAAARLAHHWLEAGSQQRALPHLATAGEVAVNAAAYEEAIGFLRQAISIASDDDSNQAHWHERLGLALVNLGRFSEAESAEHRALSLLGDPFPSNRGLLPAIAADLTRQARVRVRFGRDPTVGSGRARAALVGRAYETLATVYYTDNQAARSVFVVLAQLNAAEAGPDSDARILGYSSTAMACGFANLSRAARHYEQLASREVARSDTQRAHAIFGLYIGLHRSAEGRWVESIEALHAARDLFDVLGEPIRGLTARSVGSVTSFLAGDLDAAWEAAELVHQQAVAQDHPQFEGIGLMEMASVQLRRGHFADALDSLEAAIPLGQRIGRTQLVWANGLYALALFQLGRVGDAARAADAALDQMSGLRPVAHYHLDSYAALAEVAHRVDQIEGTRSSARRRRRAAAQLRLFGLAFRVGRPTLLIWQAWRAQQLGHCAIAERLSTFAIRIAEKLDMPHELGQALRLRADAHGEGSLMRMSDLSAAIAAFRRSNSLVALAEAQARAHNEDQASPRGNYPAS